MPWIVWTKVRSTPTLAAKLLNSGSPDRGGKVETLPTIILFRRGAKAFFVYGFSKNQRANIDDNEEKQFKEAAKHVLALTDKQLAELLERGDFVEIKVK